MVLRFAIETPTGCLFSVSSAVQKTQQIFAIAKKTENFQPAFSQLRLILQNTSKTMN